jgi:diguanylate cyclase (GGDEF)-like protein
MNGDRAIILVVDDSPTGREHLSRILGEEHDVIFAQDGPAGLALARDRIPDLILLDVQMPVMDGYEICALLKADVITRAIPVIFITAMSRQEDEERGLRAGAIDYIMKPVSPPIVKARVKNHLELKRYHDVLENLSSIDGLTGIANRRRFDERMDAEWRRARRGRFPISLALADIDFFKQYNDHYGHPAGDSCLRSVAGTMAGALRRPADLAARYGGEEFALLLPETGGAGALHLAEGLRTAVEALGIPHARSGIAGSVTVSIGLATFLPSADEDPAAVILMADKLLYHAKKSGRNRVASMVRP